MLLVCRIRVWHTHQNRKFPFPYINSNKNKNWKKNSTTYTFQYLDEKVIGFWFWVYISLLPDKLFIKENDTKNGKSCFPAKIGNSQFFRYLENGTYFQKNECDFCNQHNIFVLEKLVTTGRWHENVKVHRVILPWLCKNCIFP